MNYLLQAAMLRRLGLRLGRRGFLWTGAAVALMTASVAFASDAGTTATDTNYTNLIDLFNRAASAWAPSLTSAATALYWGLVTINLVLTFLPMAIKGADLGDWAEGVVKWILVTGFYLYLIHNYQSMATAVINGFRHAAQNAINASGGTATLTPTDILGNGVDLANTALAQTSIWSPILSVAIGITACIIYIVFALVAGLVALTLVESYIIINCAVIFLGWAGLSFTNDMARHAIKYVFGVGVKLFTLQLIVGISMTVFQAWTTQYTNPTMLASAEDIFGLAGLVVLVFFLAVYLPPAMMGMVTGGHGAGIQMGAMIAGGVAIGAGAAKAAAGAAGAGSAVQGAQQLASEQLQSKELSGSPSGGGAAGRAAAMTGQTLLNLAGGALSDVGARLGGRPGASQGTMGGRMGDAMRSQADTLKSERGKPQPPSGAPQAPAPAPTPSEPQPSAAGSSGGAPPHFFGDNFEQQMAMDANPNSTFVTTAQKGDDGTWSRTTVRYDQGQKPLTPAPEHPSAPASPAASPSPAPEPPAAPPPDGGTIRGES